MPPFMPRPDFWDGKRVLITGATGFKGAWLSAWLERLGANLSALALKSHHEPSIFDLSGIEQRINFATIDIRDRSDVKDFIRQSQPEVVLHLAAQALVFTSINDPVATFEANALGTLNLLEACRDVSNLRTIVVVTSDKVYGDTQEICNEGHPLGGSDPYAASKACAELIAATYATHYLKSERAIGLATARAGNVIGAGDFNSYRLLPDLVRGSKAGRTVIIRNPDATRPWQHVMDALCGYLCLAERLWKMPTMTALNWNFGPVGEPEWTVAQMVDTVSKRLGNDWLSEANADAREAALLRLSSRQAVEELGWQPRLSTEMAIDWAVKGYVELLDHLSIDWLAQQISEYEALPVLDGILAEDRVDVAISA